MLIDLVYHSTLGLRVKRKKKELTVGLAGVAGMSRSLPRSPGGTRADQTRLVAQSSWCVDAAVSTPGGDAGVHVREGVPRQPACVGPGGGRVEADRAR